MTIRNPDSYMEGVWDWAILDGCFGATKIKPTDLDGMVERNGWKLVIETKGPGVTLPIGQMRTFESLRRDGNWTILIVWGPRNRPEQIQMMTRWATWPAEPCNLQKLRAEVDRWFRFADSHKWEPAPIVRNGVVA